MGATHPQVLRRTDCRSGDVRRSFMMTGAAGGLGRAMVAGLIQHGYRGVAVDRDIDALRSLASEVDRPDRLVTIDANLASQEGIDRVLSDSIGAFGHVDILVNNAALGPNSIKPDYLASPAVVDEVSPQLIRQFFEVNAIAPMLLAIGLIPGMRREGWGRIINVTTSLPSMLRRGFVPYGGSKAALEAHSAIMAQDLEGTGITVNVLIPGGAADTAMVPAETGLKRAALIQPWQMVAPLLWLIEGEASGKRVIAGKWDGQAGSATDHPAVRPVAWSLGDDVTIMPEKEDA